MMMMDDDVESTWSIALEICIHLHPYMELSISCIGPMQYEFGMVTSCTKILTSLLTHQQTRKLALSGS